MNHRGNNEEVSSDSVLDCSRIALRVHCCEQCGNDAAVNGVRTGAGGNARSGADANTGTNEVGTAC
ncbi:hypothetical protein SDC9_55904 [bioreactor metagenome]|uniref:Uncharacterized protein n=1 Tax=bioreactor metagenome TaxID=1076179 RepID=A0A644X5L0_9ZZZZ